MSTPDLIQLGSLFVAILVAVATFVSTIVTYKMLNLSAQPLLKLEAKGIRMNPVLNGSNGKIDLSNDRIRYTISVELELSNISDHPAQDICIDGVVFFKNISPFGNHKLPVHLPIFQNVLEGNGTVKSIIINFDNYLARQIILDYFTSQSDGMPYLPTKKEFSNKKFWHSPKFSIRCYYSDKLTNEYCSEINLFFHAYLKNDTNKLELYLLNMFDLNFVSIKKITSQKRVKELDRNRHKRVLSFYGDYVKRGQLVSLVAEKERD